MPVMTIQQQIKTALAYRDLNQAELARRLGMSRQNLSQKLKKGAFTKTELEQIAEILGATWEAHFVFGDGMII